MNKKIKNPLTREQLKKLISGGVPLYDRGIHDDRGQRQLKQR